jgi:hypothetical protein
VDRGAAEDEFVLVGSGRAEDALGIAHALEFDRLARGFESRELPCCSFSGVDRTPDATAIQSTVWSAGGL